MNHKRNQNENVNVNGNGNGNGKGNVLSEEPPSSEVLRVVGCARAGVRVAMLHHRFCLCLAEGGRRGGR